MLQQSEAHAAALLQQKRNSFAARDAQCLIIRLRLLRCAKCRHDMQRKLIASGSDALTAALQEKLAPAFKVRCGVAPVGVRACCCFYHVVLLHCQQTATEFGRQLANFLLRSCCLLVLLLLMMLYL
jgi:sugar (pentulose or hexulose) kinase